MKSPNRLPRFFEEGLRYITNCPLCHSRYRPFEARIIQENDEAHLIHIQCKKCTGSVVALIMTSAMGVTSFGLVTDFLPHEVMKFGTGDPITTDDVLDLYQQKNTLFQRRVHTHVGINPLAA